MTTTGRTLTMASPIPELPDWIKATFTAITSGGLVATYLKYRNDRQGHAVTEAANEEKHTEALISTFRGYVETEQTRLQQEINQLREDYRTLQKDHYDLQKQHVSLLGIHEKCESQIGILTAKVQDLVEGLARSEANAAKRETTLKEDLLEQRMLNDNLIRGMQVDHIADQVEKNTEKLKEQGGGI